MRHIVNKNKGGVLQIAASLSSILKYTLGLCLYAPQKNPLQKLKRIFLFSAVGQGKKTLPTAIS
jgi:hypothetical protein